MPRGLAEYVPLGIAAAQGRGRVMMPDDAPDDAENVGGIRFHPMGAA